MGEKKRNKSFRMKVKYKSVTLKNPVIN